METQVKESLRSILYTNDSSVSSHLSKITELESSRSVVLESLGFPSSTDPKWSRFLKGKINSKKIQEYGTALQIKSVTVEYETFWFNLLSEMRWMSKDFAAERKTKLSKAKKLAQNSKSGFQKIKTKKLDKNKEIQKIRKRILQKIKKAVKEFWDKIAKLFLHEVQQQKRINEENKMEGHLNELLKKTKFFSDQLATRLPAQNKRVKLETGTQRKTDDGFAMYEDEEKPVTPLSGDSTSVKTEPPPVEEAGSLSAISTSESAAPMVKLPYLLSPTVTLRQYQHSGLSWLVSLYNNSLNGILADEMGLGKTLQTISLFAYLASYQNLWGPHLVIVPSSVLLNWEIEFKRFLPCFKILAYYGSPKQRKNLRIGWSFSHDVKFHVLITSYKLAVQDHWIIKRKKWCYMILDEAHQIKNFKSQRWKILLTFKTKNRLLLTGTPLQNSLIELWSLLHFLMPDIFNSHSEFKYWFVNPLTSYIETNQQKLDKSQKSNLPVFVDKLHKILKPFILRRLKINVLKQLPSKFEYTIKIPLSMRQMKLYEEFVARKKTKKQLISGGYLGMMQVLMKLRMVCNHPDIFEPRSVNSALLIHNEVKFDTEIRRKRIKDLFKLHKKEEDGYEGIHIDESDFFDTKHKYCLFKQKPPRNRSRTQTQHLQDNDDTKSHRIFRKFLNLQDRKYPAHLHLTRKSIPYLKTVKSILKDMKFLFDSCICLVNPPILATTVFNYPSYASPHSRTPLSLPTPLPNPFRQISTKLTLNFPDQRLTEYDSGKLIYLKRLLTKLNSTYVKNSAKNNKVLIFTQMTKMLNILELFLTQNGFTYVRLDGSTSIPNRQILMNKFNTNPNIFIFILSTRAGGLGINLTGANYVIFYDSDWNPQIDNQAQDRAHRIGQTRNVHIHRLISKDTIEENIFIKQRQKTQMSNLTVDYNSIKNDLIGKDGDLFNHKAVDIDVEKGDMMKAMDEVEDDIDRDAKTRLKEEEKEDDDFEEENESQVNENKSYLMKIDEYGLNLFRLGIISNPKIVFTIDQTQEGEDKYEIEKMSDDQDLLFASSSNSTDKEYTKIKQNLKFQEISRKLNGKCWTRKIDKNIVYYHNIDTNETTYFKPSILTLTPSKSYSELDENILLNIFLFLRGQISPLTLKSVCLNWYLVSKSPKLYLYVMNSYDYNYKLNSRFIRNNFLIGDNVEVILNELYYPGVISNTYVIKSGQVRYDLILLNGKKIQNVTYHSLRKDSGIRYTFIYEQNKKYGIKQLNFLHSLSTDKILEMRFSTLKAALKKAVNGDCIIVKNGIHTVNYNLVYNGKNVKIIGETEIASDLHSLVVEKVYADPLSLSPTTDRLERFKFKNITEKLSHPLQNVALDGISEKIIVKSPYAKLNGTNFQNDALKRKSNFKHYELDDEEIQNGAVFILGDVLFNLNAHVYIYRLSFIKQLQIQNFQRVCLFFIKEKSLTASKCTFNGRGFVDQCVHISSGKALFDQCHLKNSRAIGIFLAQGELEVRRSQLLFHLDCAIQASFGKLLVTRCFFSNNKNAAIRIYQFPEAAVSDKFYNLRNFMTAYMREMLQRVEFQYHDLDAVICGNITTRKQKGVYNALPYPSVEIVLQDPLNMSKPLFRITDNAKELKFYKGQKREADFKKKMTRKLHVYNNMYSLNSVFKWDPREDDLEFDWTKIENIDFERELNEEEESEIKGVLELRTNPKLILE